jgi:hypothetical protein
VGRPHSYTSSGWAAPTPPPRCPRRRWLRPVQLPLLPIPLVDLSGVDVPLPATTPQQPVPGLPSIPSWSGGPPTTLAGLLSLPA